MLCFNRLHAPLFFLRTRRVSRGTAFSLLPLDAAQLLPRSNDNQARQGRLPFSGTFSVQPVAHTTSTGPFVSRAVGLTKQGPSYNLEQPQYSTSTVTAAATHSVTGIIPAVPTADVGYLSHTRARSRAPSPSATNRVRISFSKAKADREGYGALYPFDRASPAGTILHDTR